MHAYILIMCSVPDFCAAYFGAQKNPTAYVHIGVFVSLKATFFFARLCRVSLPFSLLKSSFLTGEVSKHVQIMLQSSNASGLINHGSSTDPWILLNGDTDVSITVVTFHDIIYVICDETLCSKRISLHQQRENSLCGDQSVNHVRCLTKKTKGNWKSYAMLTRMGCITNKTVIEFETVCS